MDRILNYKDLADVISQVRKIDGITLQFEKNIKLNDDHRKDLREIIRKYFSNSEIGGEKTTHVLLKEKKFRMYTGQVLEEVLPYGLAKVIFDLGDLSEEKLAENGFKVGHILANTQGGLVDLFEIDNHSHPEIDSNQTKMSKYRLLSHNLERYRTFNEEAGHFLQEKSINKKDLIKAEKLQDRVAGIIGQYGNKLREVA